MGREIQDSGFAVSLGDATEQFAAERQRLLKEKDAADAHRTRLAVELEETRSRLSVVVDEVRQLRSHVGRLRAAINETNREFAAERTALLQENTDLETRLEDARAEVARAEARADKAAAELTILAENQARAAAEWEGERLSLSFQLEAVGEEIRKLLGQEDAAGRRVGSGDRRIDRPLTPQIAELRAASPEAIVRILPAAKGSAPDPDGSQAIVIIPHAVPIPGAILDLEMCSDTAGRIALELHVIEGEVAIGMISRSGDKIVAEHPVAAGPPFTRVELGFSAEDRVGSLVFRNLSRLGPTRMMLHRLEYKIGS